MGAAGALGLAFGGTAIVNAIKAQIAAALEYADKLSNLSVSTSISVQGLQRLESIGVTSGVSIETLAGAVETLQRKLDDPAARGAIRQMGLDYEFIRRLRPEDQFLQLAAAVSKIADPIARANAGAALFGKTWSTIAPALAQDLDEVIKNTNTMSDEQVKALDRAGDEWDRWYLNASRRLKAFMGDLVASDRAFQESRFFWQTWGDLPKKMPKAPPAPQTIVSGITTVDPTAISSLVVYGQTLEETRKTAEAKIKTDTAGAASQKKYADAVAASLERIRYTQFQMGESAVRASQNVAGFQVRMAETVLVNRDFSKTLTASTIQTDKFGHVVTSNVLPSLGQLGQGLIDVTEETVSFGTSVTEFFKKDFGRAVAGAIQGGGAPIKAAVTGLGQSIFAENAGLTKAIAGGVTKVFGSEGMLGKIGKEIGGMVPIIGSFIGPAVEGITKLFGKVFGKSEETKTVSPLRDEFFKLQGGIEALNPRVETLTGNLTLVQAVFNAKTVEQYNAAIAALNGLFQQETDALAVLTATADKYGLTLEELGPALQKQNLDKQAQQIYKDWEILNAAGIKSEAITTRMAASVNAYVEQAVAMGTEVPDAMRPMLEKMVEMGQLTDASGKKVDSLEAAGVSFALTMSQGFQALITEVQKLAEVLSRSLGTAVEQTTRQIRGIPSTVPIDVHYTTSGHVPSGSGGKVPGYQGGTHGKFVDFGAGSLVMLHGREAVVPESEAGPVGGGIGGARGATGGAGVAVTIHVHAQGSFFDTPGDLQRLAEKVNEALTAKLNLTNRARAA
jgi:hypothetical protein